MVYNYISPHFFPTVERLFPCYGIAFFILISKFKLPGKVYAQPVAVCVSSFIRL